MRLLNRLLLLLVALLALAVEHLTGGHLLLILALLTLACVTTVRGTSSIDLSRVLVLMRKVYSLRLGVGLLLLLTLLFSRCFFFHHDRLSLR